MKNIVASLCSCLFVFVATAQTSRSAFSNQVIPPFQKEKVYDAFKVTDIIPNCPPHWRQIIEILSSQILAVCNGQPMAEENEGEYLTRDQKMILNSADMGTEIALKLKFRWKDSSSPVGDYGRALQMNEYRFAVAPAKEAEYPGGYTAAKKYVNETVMTKVTGTGAPYPRHPGIMADFTVNEKGIVENIRLSKASGISELDHTVVEAISKMPAWTAAENSKGKKVKQEIKFTLLATLVPADGLSPRVEVQGKEKRVKKEMLKSAERISDFIPDYPVEWREVIDYVQVEISGNCNGKALTESNNSDALNAGQKALLNAVDAGSDLGISIKFRYKNPEDEKRGSFRKIKETAFMVNVAEEMEAEFPGGDLSMKNFIKSEVFEKPDSPETAYQIRAMAKFVVNERGEVVEAGITQSSMLSGFDKLLLEAISKMPKWKPAKNAKGENVRQEIRFTIGYGNLNGC